jgi:hypothetical protein
MHAAQPSIPQPTSYFDPAANAQLAQWAYQQMVFNAQQAHQLHMSPLSAASRNSPAEYFPPTQLSQSFNAFPSGAPPPLPNHTNNSFPSGQRGSVVDPNGGPQYNGFHPYRRPNRQPSRQTDTEWRTPAHKGLPQPPYARTDASGSTSSLNSASSHDQGPSRSRTNSNQSVHSANGHSPSNRNGASSVPRGRPHPPSITTGQINGVHGRTGSTSSSSAGPSSVTTPTSRHHRTQSSSSSTSSVSARPSAPATPSAASSGVPVPRPARPSPLSQGNFTAAEKRISRDDSDLAAMRDVSSSASMLRGGGLKGRLRRAFTFNTAAHTLEEDESGDDRSIKASSSRPKSPFDKFPSASGSSVKPDGSEDLSHEPPDPSSASLQHPKKKSRSLSLFNTRMNMSTDNISLSSTVSSASVMIRKLGSIGKLARRNSLAGITSLFKDKKDKDVGDSGGGVGKKNKKNGKSEPSSASVSHVTAELDRSGNGGDWSINAEMSGLSPAAKLARQHTLKSNAEAAAKAKAQQEAAAASLASTNAGTSVVSTLLDGSTHPTETLVPSLLDKDAAIMQSFHSSEKRAELRVNQDGTRVLIEDDDSASDGSVDELASQIHGQHDIEWDEDDWNGDEDMTIRLGLERTAIHEDGEDESLQWALDIRRSIEKTRKPTKGILKSDFIYFMRLIRADHGFRRRSL